MKASLKELLANILGVDFRYPVGSYYETSDASFDPNTAWGGTWVLEDEGRFLQATKVASKAGTTVGAGLPEISGEWVKNASNGSTLEGVLSGGFLSATGAYGTDTVTANVFWPSLAFSSSQLSAPNKMTFRASRSNSIYGNSTTVQPKSRLVYMWHRTA